MKLLVDIGNTRLKSALLHEGHLLEHRALSWRGEGLAERLAELWADMQPSGVAISSVAAGEVVQQVRMHAQNVWRLQPQLAVFRDDTLGLRCGYKQPQKLGIDRWLAMLGAWGRSQSAWVVADLGTAATIDVIDNSGQHLGGCIYAGVETQRRALSQQTAALPQVEADCTDLLANETHAGIALGTLMSVVGGVRELYNNAQTWAGCEDIALCLTGGSAPAVAERLGGEHAVFPYLVLEGLAASEYGIEKIALEGIAKPS